MLNYKAHSYTIDLRMFHFTCAVTLLTLSLCHYYSLQKKWTLILANNLYKFCVKQQVYYELGQSRFTLNFTQNLINQSKVFILTITPDGVPFRCIQSLAVRGSSSEHNVIKRVEFKGMVTNAVLHHKHAYLLMIPGDTETLLTKIC